MGGSFSPRRIGAILALALSLLAALLLGGRGLYHKYNGAPATHPDLASWDVPRMAEHLRSHGLSVRLVPFDQAGTPDPRAAYLTTTDKGWEELGGLARLPERIATWKGTLYCERINRPETLAGQVRLWGDCCLTVGPFVFFGDPDLLTRVRAAFRLDHPRTSEGWR